MGTTDIVRIIHYYDGPSFGFASRNFYAEFLAALDIEKDQEAYLGRPSKDGLR
jgi:membrane-bound lytic murein transglycosylase D